MKQKILIVVSVLLVCCLCACHSGIGTNSSIEISFSSSSPADSSDNATIYINDAADKVTLDAALEVDCGEVTIQVTNSQSGDIKWSGVFTENTTFIIELSDVEADAEYLVTVQALQSSKMKLSLTSTDSLVERKENPEKYIIEKPEKVS